MNSKPKKQQLPVVEEDMDSSSCSTCNNDSGNICGRRSMIPVPETSTTPTTISGNCNIVEEVIPEVSGTTVNDDSSSYNNNHTTCTTTTLTRRPLYPKTAYNYFFQYERNRIFLYGIHHTYPYRIPLLPSAASLSTLTSLTNDDVAEGGDEEVDDVTVVPSTIDNNNGMKQHSDQPQQTTNTTTNKKLAFTDLVRTIVVKWKTLDPTVKEYFQQKAHDDTIRYQKELQQWKESNECK